MDASDKIRDLLKSCLLPELTQDLDTIPIEIEHFKSYHECLQLQLPILYDWIQQISEVTKQEIQADLIVLLCEVSNIDSIFVINEPQLISTAEKYLQNTGNLPKEIDERILNYYEDKLYRDKWKKQLGAVHGFAKYLEFRFTYAHDHDQIMNQKLLKFCLSVAMNVRSCYETNYKSLSTTIFLVMLQRGRNDNIISMNVHSVIYDAVFKDIHIMDSICFIAKQWNCLVQCLDYYKEFDSFTWNYLDDMMEVLLRNITLAPDAATSICHLRFVSRLIVYFTINRKEYEKLFEKDLTRIKHIHEYRSLGQTNSSYTNYRWAKDLLQMFVLESHKLMQGTIVVLDIVHEIHKIYMLAILPIRLPIIDIHLTIFLEKFITVLMETIKIHEHHASIMPAISSLLETFYIHLQQSDKLVKLLILRENIRDLLKSDAFKLFSTI